MCIKWTIRIREEGSKEGVGRYIAGYQTKSKSQTIELWILIVSTVKTHGCNKTKTSKLTNLPIGESRVFVSFLKKIGRRANYIHCKVVQAPLLLHNCRNSFTPCYSENAT